MARTAAVMAAAVLLAGCAQPPAQVVSPPPKPQPKMVWTKVGEGDASNEAFQRIRARCVMYAEANQVRNAWGGPFGNSWVVLADACMRSAGWVQVPEKNAP